MKNITSAKIRIIFSHISYGYFHHSTIDQGFGNILHNIQNIYIVSKHCKKSLKESIKMGKNLITLLCFIILSMTLVMACKGLGELCISDCCKPLLCNPWSSRCIRTVPSNWKDQNQRDHKIQELHQTQK